MEREFIRTGMVECRSSCFRVCHFVASCCFILVQPDTSHGFGSGPLFQDAAL
ncbi:MAG: hypothetical protein QG577_2363 [Thermodesulfobacteriota bacterium]|nr:hypothetical protein [Thermodesulfobacteriota bacterium]